MLNPETVARFVNCKQPTAKTARLQLLLHIVHTPDTEYSPLPSLYLRNQTLLILRKSIFLSSLFENNLILYQNFYTPLPNIYHSLKTLPVHFSFNNIVIIMDLLLHEDLVLTLPHSIFPLFRVTLHYASQGNTANYYPLILILQNLFHSHISHLVLTLFHYFLLTYKLQTAYLSGILFSEVQTPTPDSAHVRLPDYFTAEHSRPPTPNFEDYSIRVDGVTMYDPKNDPRFPILAERFFTTNGSLPNKRKETELKRLQSTIQS